MLPESKDCPTDLDEVIADPRVTRAIAFDFLQPKSGILLDRWRMDIASMPEAAIEKDRDLQAGKGDVASNAVHSGNGIMHPIAEPFSIELRSD